MMFDSPGDVTGGTRDTGSLARVAEATPDLVYLLKPDGTILDANPALCRLLRQPRERIAGMTIVTHLDADYVAISERALHEIVERKTPLRSTRCYHVPGMEPRTFEMMECPLIREGRVWAIAGIGREITQEAILEHKLWDTEESRQWTVDFALRAALGLVKGYIYTLCQGGVPDEERRSRYVRVIEEEIDHVSKIVEDLLDIRRMECGELLPAAEIVDVHDSIAHVMLQCGDEAERREIELVADTGPGIQPLHAPREALVRILMNLVQNAIHHTLHEGRVVVEARDHESYVEIHVKDNGVGIPDDEIPHVFNKYYRGKNSAASPAQGVGLGLAVTRMLVEALGGKIWVSSRVGEGSDFGVVIPRQPFEFSMSDEPELWKLSSASSDAATIE